MGNNSLSKMSIFAITTLPLIIVGAIFYGIIGNKHRHNTIKEEMILEETIKGVPLSVNHESYGKGIIDLNMVIKTESDKKVLAQPYLYYGHFCDASELATIVDSEINDGDNEPIELRGIYKENTFKFWYLKANGFTRKNSEYD